MVFNFMTLSNGQFFARRPPESPPAPSEPVVQPYPGSPPSRSENSSTTGRESSDDEDDDEDDWSSSEFSYSDEGSAASTEQTGDFLVNPSWIFEYFTIT